MKYVRTIVQFNMLTYGLMWTGANDVFGSIRIDLYSFASLLLKLGLVNAINLDGGGSATMVVNNTLVNYPSDEWWVCYSVFWFGSTNQMYFWSNNLCFPKFFAFFYFFLTNGIHKFFVEVICWCWHCIVLQNNMYIVIWNYF